MDKSVHNKALLCLLNNTINKAGPTGPSFVTPGLLFSYVVRCHKERLRKIAVASKGQNTNNMHVNLSRLKVEERLTSSLVVFVRGIDMLNAQS